MEKPLVYSCSGCSNVAQLANRLAVSLNQQGLAEMSCIAGIGGNVKPLVRKAKSGRQIIAIDGCPLACVKHCLKQHQLSAHEYYDLTTMGLKKRYDDQCDNEDFQLAFNIIASDLSTPKIVAGKQKR